MPTAITAIFGADGRPMDAEWARQEVTAKRFGKTIQALNAETYGAENAQMERNREAIRALIAEKEMLIAEQERYNAALMAGAGNLTTPAKAREAENASLLANSAALKQLNAERQAAKAELERYNAALASNAGGLKTVADLTRAEDAVMEQNAAMRRKLNAELLASRVDAARYAQSVGGGTMPARMQNAVDQEAWLVKLAAAKGISVEMLKSQQAAKEAELATRGISSGITAASGHVPGLNLVLRETLVIFREIGRGNWARVPGSFSLVVQGLRNMRAELGIFGALFTLTGLAVVGSIGAIVAAWFIFEHRVKALTAALTQIEMPDLVPRDPGRLTAWEIGWRRIQEAIRDATDEANSANAAFEKMKALMDQQHGTQKRLLDIQKESAMEAAGNDPVARARVRAEFAKREHDQEAAQQQDNLRLIREHAEALRDEEAAKKAQADAIKVSTEEDERSTLEDLKARAKAGTEKKRGSKGEELASDLEEAQATIDKFATRVKRDAFGNVISGVGSLSGDEQAALSAAQDKVAQHQRAEKELEDYERTKKDRDDLREKQRKLYEEAAAAGAGSQKAKADYAAAAQLQKKILADDDQIRAAEGAQEAAKDVARGESGRGFSLNAQQRIGAYATTPPDMKIQTELLRQIVSNTKPQAHAPANAPVPTRNPQIGGLR